MATPRHFYGWVRDVPDQRDQQFLALNETLAALPPRIDLRPQCPAVYQQGKLGSCTANAIAGGMEFDLRKQGRPTFTPSRLFIYYNERVMEDSVDSDPGAQLRDGIKSVRLYGACPEREWPYIIARFRRKPTARCYSDAKRYEAVSYKSVQQSLTQMQGCLAEGYPFVFGFSVYMSFESQQVATTGVVDLPKPGEPGAGEQGQPAGHAVLAVGYDNAGSRFIVRNSWGSSWGMAGYFTMPYEYLLDRRLADDFWTIRVVGRATAAPKIPLAGRRQLIRLGALAEVPRYSAAELAMRKRLAIELTDSAETQQAFRALAAAQPTTDLNIPYPAGFRPRPTAPTRQPTQTLPEADVVAVTYTVDEARALADVLTPGVGSIQWKSYRRHYAALERLVGPRGPSRRSRRLGSYWMTAIGGVRVLVFKSELHLSTDWKSVGGKPTLPIRDLFGQIISDARPKLVITTGTAGGLYCSMHLGDVGVSRAAQFLCQSEFKNAPFNGKAYRSEWQVPTGRLRDAESLMQRFAVNLAGGTDGANRTCRCGGPGTPTRIWVDGDRDIPPFHPILTTDFFEYGTSTNHLDKTGLAVEMDDAVLGLVCADLDAPPHWLAIRNLSDPCINGKLDKNGQVACAVRIYKHYGYWTSVMSALTVWGVVAGMQ
jgi:hypothetical protein